jgi:hypothetical protein
MVWMFTIRSCALLLIAGVATASSTEDDILRVIGTLVSSSSGGSLICRKADAFRKQYSVRSFNGSLCAVDYVAAFAELQCKGISDFTGSQCDRTAEKTLKGADPMTVLKASIKEKKGKAHELVCPHLSKLGPKLKGLATSCR